MKKCKTNYCNISCNTQMKMHSLYQRISNIVSFNSPSSWLSSTQYVVRNIVSIIRSVSKRNERARHYRAVKHYKILEYSGCYCKRNFD